VNKGRDMVALQHAKSGESIQASFRRLGSRLRQSHPSELPRPKTATNASARLSCLVRYAQMLKSRTLTQKKAKRLTHVQSQERPQTTPLGKLPLLPSHRILIGHSPARGLRRAKTLYWSQGPAFRYQSSGRCFRGYSLLCTCWSRNGWLGFRRFVGKYTVGILGRERTGVHALRILVMEMSDVCGLENLDNLII